MTCMIKLKDAKTDFHRLHKTNDAKTVSNVLNAFNNFPQLMVTIPSGVNGRPVRIHVVPGLCLEVVHVPTPLQPTADLTAQDWGDPCRAHSVTLWTVQVMNNEYMTYVIFHNFSCRQFLEVLSLNSRAGKQIRDRRSTERAKVMSAEGELGSNKLAR